MSRKTNKTITAVGMAVLMTAAGVLTAMAAQSPTITAGNGMSQIEAVGPGVQSPDAEQEQAPIWEASSAQITAVLTWIVRPAISMRAR